MTVIIRKTCREGDNSGQVMRQGKVKADITSKIFVIRVGKQVRIVSINVTEDKDRLIDEVVIHYRYC